MKAVEIPTPSDPQPRPQSATRNPRGRPRKITTDQKILSAALELLKERGYDAMSFEAIAQRAGVTRPAIYRRWPSKAHLVSDLVVRRADPDIMSFSQVGVGEGIASWMKAMIERYGQPEMKAALGGLVSTYQAAPELRLELEGSIEAKTRKEFETFIRTNQKCGRVRRNVVPDTLFDIVVGAVFYRSLGSSFEGSPDFVKELCEIVMKGIEMPESGSTE